MLDLVRRAFLSLALFVSLFPVVWMFITSVKPDTSDLAVILQPVLFVPQFDFYKELLYSLDFRRLLFNSLVVGLASTSLSIAISIPAAYAIAEFHSRGRSIVYFLTTYTRALPAFALLIPLTFLFVKVGLYDTTVGLAFAHTLTVLPITLWLFYGLYSELPPNIWEAAELDGCSKFGAYVRVILPLSKPYLIAAFAISFLLSWNELPYAMVITSHRALTAPLGILSFVNPKLASEGFQYVQDMAAAGILQSLPALALAYCLQRWASRAFTFGAVKEL